MFAASCYPRLTHLCIPGDSLNASDQTLRARARASGHTLAHPTPRPSRPDAAFAWQCFDRIFPALTHLYLPGLLVPPATHVNLARDQLVKLSLGFGGPPVRVEVLNRIISNQIQSLRSVHIGHLCPESQLIDMSLLSLGEWLSACLHLEDFRFASDPGGSKDRKCDQAMEGHSRDIYVPEMRRSWRASLKVGPHIIRRISADVSSIYTSRSRKHWGVSTHWNRRAHTRALASRHWSICLFRRPKFVIPKPLSGRWVRSGTCGISI
jgi:hypothetical protein